MNDVMRNYCVVISRAWPPDPQRDQFAERLAEELAGVGVHALLIPELYHVGLGSEALKAFQDLKSPIIFCSWLHRRAAYWTLHVMGVPSGRVVETEQGGTRHCPLVCVSLRDERGSGRVLDQVREHFGGAFPGGQGKVRRVEGVGAERWYPVIDGDRCKNCQECAEFCLFGVYGKNEGGQIFVEHPDACKPGCPACSRVCPQQAIIFPLYETDDAIAGSDEGRIKPFDAETWSRIQQHRAQAPEPKPKHVAALQALADGCRCKDKPGGDKPAAAPAKPAATGGNQYFDQIIDRLAKE